MLISNCSRRFRSDLKMTVELLRTIRQAVYASSEYLANDGLFSGMPGFVVDFLSKKTLHRFR